MAASMIRIPRLERTLVMGIVNVTPDSFSDGGEFLQIADAVRRGLELFDSGADVVDVGGESTRPGAARADLATELERVVPVVEELAGRGVPVSVDTMRAEVAAAAAAAGAALINDVSGGLADPEMLPAVAQLNIDYVAMHWRGHSADMAELATYRDVVAEVRDELAARLSAATAAGVASERIILDPGLGFAKTAAHNWALLQGIDELAGLGRPLLIGASRKRFFGELLATPEGPRDVRDRESAGVALTALLARRGVWGVRTHTARPHRDAIAVATRLR